MRIAKRNLKKQTKSYLAPRLLWGLKKQACLVGTQASGKCRNCRCPLGNLTEWVLKSAGSLNSQGILGILLESKVL